MNLAVKYRPKDFDEVVGQELNTKILKRQIEEEDLAKGYLFSGSSGIGKTTLARILANKINAEVIEIDGASHNGVDQIRKIRENTKLKSMTSTHKVYIIDEAHQLSSSAFNALLKTLEEPPKGVIFILATTEPEKILPTIHTRLQHFQFTRVSWQKIAERLRQIIAEEKEELDNKLINYISKIAQGSVRSAISILEKILLIENPTIEDVTQMTGSVDYDFIFKLFTLIVRDKSTKGVLQLIEKAHEEGKNLTRLIEQTSEFTVELIKYAIFRDFDYIKIPEMYKDQLEELIEVTKESDFKLREVFNQFNELHNDLRYENDEKLLIQGKLMQMLGD